MNTHSENHFIEKFKKRLETVKNKKYLIENEINQIQAFTSQIDKDPNFMGELNFANETNSVFDLMEMGNPVFFNSVFNRYLLDDEYEGMFKYDPEMKNDPAFANEIEEAVLFAEYYKWLQELEVKPTKKSNFSNLNNDQKLLALHFLGLDLRDFTKEHTAKVLGQILNIGSENIRRNLSILQGGKNNLRSTENLEKLLELFENKTFESIQNKINKEIKNLT
ncbi:hypothetical protein FUA26_03770 [Seonamhaeicola algicola]|uniref:Uncharacterized protein n=1 Tax=Seonamhaeicola algicola TaxID=1719036 RepID=A0A5C7AZ07_9FLAO|nr:hypothetical protein [Seonamhaeicola algicola]TXE12923.1 hypothetical protein FUA26_03770 [Seonamhaeicola algicola]